jgi:short coiled-coil protein
MPNRKSSGTIIVRRDDPNIELKEEEYDEGDARTMSPRRTSEEVDRLEESARQALVQCVAFVLLFSSIY